MPTAPTLSSAPIIRQEHRLSELGRGSGGYICGSMHGKAGERFLTHFQHAVEYTDDAAPSQDLQLPRPYSKPVWFHGPICKGLVH
jgi:hypothetical protein